MHEILMYKCILCFSLLNALLNALLSGTFVSLPSN